MFVKLSCKAKIRLFQAWIFRVGNKVEVMSGGNAQKFTEDLGHLLARKCTEI